MLDAEKLARLLICQNQYAASVDNDLGPRLGPEGGVLKTDVPADLAVRRAVILRKGTQTIVQIDLPKLGKYPVFQFHWREKRRMNQQHFCLAEKQKTSSGSAHN